MPELLARIVHSSDWHLCYRPHNPLSYFSKRLLAYGSHLLNPKRRFRTDWQGPWIQKVKELRPTHLVISGDLTMTGLEAEFDHADRWIRELQALIPNVLVLGGNHDVYLERALDKGLFLHLKKWLSPSIAEELFHSKISSLTQGDIEFILIDVSQPTPWGNASGEFNSSMHTKLEETLRRSQLAKQRIVVCHYPLQPMLRQSHTMIGHNLLLTCLKGHQNLIYLHGHTHRQHVINERFYGYPITCDAGCLSDPRKAGFAMIDIFPGSFKLHLMNFDPLHGWQTHQTLMGSNQQ